MEFSSSDLKKYFFPLPIKVFSQKINRLYIYISILLEILVK